MSFTTPNGTYGAEFPATAAQMHEMNESTVAAIRAGRSDGGMQTLVLITTGRRSGRVRENPVAYFPQPDGSWLISASAAGAARNPDWYANLAADPEGARIVLDGAEFAVDAEELHGQDREHHWRRITETSPGFARYETLTDRVIPVIRLTRRDPAEPATPAATA